MHIGLVETAAGVSGIAGAIVAPWVIERVPTGWLTVVAGWTFVPLVVPMAIWNHPAVVAAALGLGLFLNPAGNAGIGAYRIAVTPAELQGRIQSTMQFVSMSVLPLAPVLAAALLAGLGGGAAVAVLGGLTALVALIPTLSRSVRSVPRPRDWASDATPVPVKEPAPARPDGQHQKVEGWDTISAAEPVPTRQLFAVASQAVSRGCRGSPRPRPGGRRSGRSPRSGHRRPPAAPARPPAAVAAATYSSD